MNHSTRVTIRANRILVTHFTDAEYFLLITNSKCNGGNMDHLKEVRHFGTDCLVPFLFVN